MTGPQEVMDWPLSQRERKLLIQRNPWEASACDAVLLEPPKEPDFAGKLFEVKRGLDTIHVSVCHAVGSGAFGKVYRACTEAGDCALKVLSVGVWARRRTQRLSSFGGSRMPRL